MQLTAAASPRLIEAFGVGADTAGALLVAVGANPERLRSEAAFSMLCGSSPIKASSGKTNRHRLNRGGNRQANAALYRIVLVRMRYHQPTRDYVVRRTSEGKSKREIIRCLKRYVAREIYTALTQTSEQNSPAPLDIYRSITLHGRVQFLERGLVHLQAPGQGVGVEPFEWGSASAALPQRVRLGQGLELLQRVVLDLADPFARDAERAADLFKRMGLCTVQSVPELDHLPLALG